MALQGFLLRLVQDLGLEGLASWCKKSPPAEPGFQPTRSLPGPHEEPKARKREICIFSLKKSNTKKNDNATFFYVIQI